MYKIGVDLGGTKTEAALLDENFQVIERKRISTVQDYTTILKSITSLVNELKQKTTDDLTIGVCTPGILSQKNKLIKNSNTKCLIGKPLKEDLEKSIGLQISMDNDANCFALAEAKLGVAKNFDVVFGIIMGTGIGGGLIINKKIYHGRTLIAGEWGHHIIRNDGKQCYCGKKGCVETYISGPALEKRWTEITGKQESLEAICHNLNRQESNIWKNEFLENFSIGLSNVINILDPDVIVLGGGLSNISFLYDEGKKLVYRKVFSDYIDTPIIKNNLGDAAGVFGACLL